jgi:hypothetical protein
MHGGETPLTQTQIRTGSVTDTGTSLRRPAQALC